MTTPQESLRAFKKFSPVLEEKIKLDIEKKVDQSHRYVVRAVHNWSLWSNNKPFTYQKGTTQAELANVEIHGQVASLYGPTRFAVMAGEIYIPAVQFENAKIKGIRSVSVHRGQYYRGGTEATFKIKTQRYAYVLIQPEIFYEPHYRAMCGEFEGVEGFTIVYWQHARPVWWRHLRLWLDFKTWARRELADGKTDVPTLEGVQEDKSGDKARPDDLKDSEEGGEGDEGAHGNQQEQE
ncbi:hypothetical protein BDV93DRAFT_612297 [Ceratobasidium sp. AG-I]|nr:hypothetical protein BDV93DRAFT_612297 [Ceratobasidium sp. AG-I]